MPAQACRVRQFLPAVGAITIGDWVYVAGGGAVRSAVHEAFTLG
ncbi:MAG: hypothetical protein U0987_18745 [Afipia sp.]|nr:hypothetical protein [Afipia sp.]